MRRRLGKAMLAALALVLAFALDMTILAAVASTCASCRIAASR